MSLAFSTSIKGKAELTEDEVSNLREVLKAVSYELRRTILWVAFTISGRGLLPVDEFHCRASPFSHGQRACFLHSDLYDSRSLQWLLHRRTRIVDAF